LAGAAIDGPRHAVHLDRGRAHGRRRCRADKTAIAHEASPSGSRALGGCADLQTLVERA
jgi:hypothetical protein